MDKNRSQYFWSRRNSKGYFYYPAVQLWARCPKLMKIIEKILQKNKKICSKYDETLSKIIFFIYQKYTILLSPSTYQLMIINTLFFYFFIFGVNKKKKSSFFCRLGDKGSSDLNPSVLFIKGYLSMLALWKRHLKIIN